MNILITGGAGFIGSHIVDKLILENHHVTILDNLSSGSKNNINKQALFINRDITQPINDIFDQKFDCVMHMAAQIDLRKSIKNPHEDATINILGTLNILEEVRRTKVKKFIFASTGGAIYSPEAKLPCTEFSKLDPQSPYGMAKYTIENYLKLYSKLYGLNYTSLRFANVYGPRQNSKGEAGVISIFIEKALNNESLTIFGDGNQTRDFIFVKDVVKACILSFEKDLQGVFNVSTNVETSVNRIVTLLKKYLRNDITINNADKILGELSRSCLSFNALKYSAHWEPEYDLESGIKETVEYFKNSEKNIN
jgi:UDP-glucose 4-epimerase